MTHIRTGTSRNVSIAVIIFAVVLAAEVGAVLFGNVPLDAASLNPLGIFTLIMAFYLGIVVFAFVQYGHDVSAAVRGDDRVAPPVTAQPEPEMALAAGESLTLERSATTAGIRYPLVVILLLFLVMLVGMEGFIGNFLPALPWSVHLSPTIQSTLPVWFQWMIAGVVFLIFALGIWASIVAVVHDSHYVITADDSGITVRSRWQQTKHLPWNEILAFMRTSPNSGDQDLSSFQLIASNYRVVLSLQPITSSMLGSGSFLSIYQRFYRFSGGIDAYRVQSQRLLATISARSHVTLRAVQSYYGRWGRTFAPMLALTYQDVQRMPIAESSQQPTPEALLAAQHFTGKLALRRWLRGDALRRIYVLLSPFFVPLFFLQVLLAPPTHPVSHFLLVRGIFLIFVLVIEMPLAVAFFAFQMIPRVRANDAGLSILSNNSGQHATIPWGQIQAWGMMPAIGKQRSVTYAVFWSGRTLSWREPLSWRRPADQATADQLHALIAARTHLPMHVIPFSRIYPHRTSLPGI